jgi:hypothetical protein
MLQLSVEVCMLGYDPDRVIAICAIFAAGIALFTAVTLWQLGAATRSYRAMLLVHLIEEWNKPEMYEAVRYIHELREEWKTKDATREQWDCLARRWVSENSPPYPPLEPGAPNRWMQRRQVSQFISKMGYLMNEKYITRKDLFSVIAEAGRLLIVLDPIERSILHLYHNREKAPLADWDQPFMKVGFDGVWVKYCDWFADWGRLLSAPHVPMRQRLHCEGERPNKRRAIHPEEI